MRFRVIAEQWTDQGPYDALRGKLPPRTGITTSTLGVEGELDGAMVKKEQDEVGLGHAGGGGVGGDEIMALSEKEGLKVERAPWRLIVSVCLT